MESLESRVTVYFDHDQPRVRGVLRPEGSVTQFVRIGMRTRVGYTLRGFDRPGELTFESLKVSDPAGPTNGDNPGGVGNQA